MPAQQLRRGLPRVPGGEPWPPADAVATVDAAAAPAVQDSAPASVATAPAGATTSVPAPATTHASATPAAPAAETAGAAPAAPASTVAAAPAAATVAASVDSAPVAPATRASLRRGLPRTPGGELWPPAGITASATVASAAEAPAAMPAAQSPAATGTQPVADTALAAPVAEAATPAASTTSAATAVPAVASAAASTGPSVALRRGLPRTQGGDPWPPEGTVSAVVSAPVPAPVATTATSDALVGAAATDAPATATAATGEALATVPAPATSTAVETPAAASTAVAHTGTDLAAPLPFTRMVWQGKAPRHIPAPPAESTTRPVWTQAIAGLFGAAALGALAASVIFAVRAFLGLPFMQDFLAAYPGEYHLPESAPVGIPAWLGWQHFLNAFFMLLIIRTGLRVRSEKRPTVFWASRRRDKAKISLTLWLHQGLDLLWVINGIVFFVLLFVTGQWMRIVPTSWDVFPNALSAALQYASMDWPTENGWVNYNSIQQLAYFTTVFIAAPLAIITGLRMSHLWPKNAAALNKAYPVEVARALHFPVMLYFVAFIAVHVFLVFATGLLRNLNHMYAANGSTDPAAVAGDPTGLWIFLVSVLVMIGAWFAARPLVIAPIAKVFGNVSGR